MSPTPTLRRLSPHVHAWLHPTGTWGYSNCGVVASGGTGVLVDTQFTLPMTRTMLDAVHAALPDTRLTTVVTTHANGDHCWGNQLVPGARIVASAATAHGMSEEVQPGMLAQLATAPPDGTALSEYLHRYFGHFPFDGITLVPPTDTFSGRDRVRAGDVTVELIEVGPAHTTGDIIAHVPDDSVVFAGDILFIGDHPVAWTGPVRNWIAACTSIIDTGAGMVVPGHGPLVDPAGVAVFRDYLEHVDEQTRLRHAKGMPYWQAALDIPLPAPFDAWGHRERLVMLAAVIYRELGTTEDTDVFAVLSHTAAAHRRLSIP